jgi:hypothetical protein
VWSEGPIYSELQVRDWAVEVSCVNVTSEDLSDSEIPLEERNSTKNKNVNNFT